MGESSYFYLKQKDELKYTKCGFSKHMNMGGQYTTPLTLTPGVDRIFYFQCLLQNWCYWAIWYRRRSIQAKLIASDSYLHKSGQYNTPLTLTPGVEQILENKL